MGAEPARGTMTAPLEAAALAVSGDLAAAARRLEAVPEATRSAEVQAAMGLLALERGASGRGLALLDRAVETDPALTEAHYWLAVASLRSGSARAAVKALDAAVSLDRRPELRLARALARRATGDRSGAVRDLLAAAAEQPNLREPALHPDLRRGLVLLAARALSGHPDRAMVEDALTRLHHDAGLWREAAERAGSRRSGVALEVRGRLALDRGRPDEAVGLLAAAAAAAPSSASARFHLGRAAYESGAPARALAELRQAARLAPDDPRVQVAIGRIHLEQGELEPAVLAFEYALARSRSPEALVGLGRAQELAGDLDGARARYERALALAPASISALEHLGRLAERRGEAGRARALRARLRQASGLEDRFAARLEAERESARAHAELCERLGRDPLAELGAEPRGRGERAARRFARAGALARAGRDDLAEAEARAALAAIEARSWARGARPVVRLVAKVGAAVVVRAAAIDWVVLEP